MTWKSGIPIRGERNTPARSDPNPTRQRIHSADRYGRIAARSIAAFIHACADDVAEEALKHVFGKDRDFQESARPFALSETSGTLRVRRAPASDAAEQAGRKLASGWSQWFRSGRKAQSTAPRKRKTAQPRLFAAGSNHLTDGALDRTTMQNRVEEQFLFNKRCVTGPLCIEQRVRRC